MATAHVLELLSALLRKQESSKHSPQLDVVPIHVEGLDAHRQLIASAIRDAGGVLLDAADHAEGTEGTVDLELREVVTATLNARRGARPELDIREAGESARAALDGSDVNKSTSTGLRTLSGVAMTLFNDRLRESRFAAITYSESGLDPEVAVALWELLTRQLEDVRLGEVRTLAVLIGAPTIRYDRHFAQGTSLAFRLNEGGFERRKSWDIDCADIAHLRPENGRFLVLFLGAGFSASSSLPLGDDLRDEALFRLLNSYQAYPQVAERFHRHTEENGRLLPQEAELSPAAFAEGLTLERVLREELHRHGASSSPTLRELETATKMLWHCLGQPSVRCTGSLIAVVTL